MKITRSTKCSLNFASTSKRQLLDLILSEYGRVVNFFIEKFWQECPSKSRLLKPVVNVPNTWLSARLCKVAAREAIDMVRAAKLRRGDEARKPVHRGNRMCVSSMIASLVPSRRAREFDAWLQIRCVGNGIKLDLPVRFHKHWYCLTGRTGSRRLESYIITKDYVQFAFEIETGAKRIEGDAIGVDTGIRALATLSDGRKFGQDIPTLVERIKRCQHGSNGQKRARRALRQRMDEVAKEILATAPRLIVVEKLKGLNHKAKKRRRLGRNMRRSLGAWAYRYWINRLRMGTEDHRVSFRAVPPAVTSLRCSACGHTERRNRATAEMFLCRSCGHTDDADVNAARNILVRFLTGAYGPGCQPRDAVSLGVHGNAG